MARVTADLLTEEQREIRDLIRELARERIAPRAAEIDKSSEFPWDVVELFREHGIFGVMYDEEYGGLGASALMTLVAVEEVSKVCATSGLILALQELGSLGVKLAGNEEQKEKDLVPLAIDNPERPVFRRLLVEVYGAVAYPLLHRTASGDPAEVKAACTGRACPTSEMPSSSRAWAPIASCAINCSAT